MSDLTPENVRVMLSRIGLSQSEVARVVGAQERTVRRWLGGEPGPDGDSFVPSPQHWLRLFNLCKAQDRAAEQAMRLIRRLRTNAEETGRSFEPVSVRLARDDVDARRAGMPFLSAHVAVVRRIVERCEAERIPYEVVAMVTPPARG
jgi:predicted transcriptional regulator